MQLDKRAVEIGTEIPAFLRTTGFHNWNRYAAVNDEFVPIHMDPEAGRAAGFPGPIGMGNLMFAYLHNMLRDWAGDEATIVSVSCTFRAPNLQDMTVEARGRVVGIRAGGDGRTLVDLEVAVVDHDDPSIVIAPGQAVVALD
jgi:acyl dehydratase